MAEFKLIVAGGRDFVDEKRMTEILLNVADKELLNSEVSIVSGMAPGADALGYKFAHTHGVKVYEFPANWRKYGKRAGFVRNAEMGQFADGVLAFWDGQSKGTKNMIDYMTNLKKLVMVVNY